MASEWQNNRTQSEVEELLRQFVVDWNNGDVEKACSSYADNAVYISRGSGERYVGRQAIVDHYHEGNKDADRNTLKLEIIDFWSLPTQLSSSAKSPIAVAVLCWTTYDSQGNSTGSGFAAEMYLRNEQGKLEAMMDAS